MSGPKRIRLSRAKGYRLPEGAINCARPGRYGNPARVVLDKMVGFGEEDDAGNEILKGPWACLISKKGAVPAGWWFSTREEAVAKAIEYYRFLVNESPGAQSRRAAIQELRGHDLACWCSLSSPCHVDVQLEIANAITPESKGTS